MMFLMVVLLVVSYFLVVGLVVLLESKLLGYIGGSVGPSSVCLGSYYLFMVDFVKFVFKFGSKSTNSSWIGIILFLLLMEVLSVISYFLLPVSFLGSVSGSYLYFLILNIVVSILKMVLVKGFVIEFVKSVGESLVKLFIILEVLFSFICFMYIMVFVGVGVNSWSEVISVLGNGKSTSMVVFGLLPMSILLYMILLLKVSSSPYDFMESESEFVGGLSTEFHGMFFGIWSAIEYSTVINGVWTVFVFGFSVFFKEEVSIIVSFSVVFTLVLIVLITSAMLVSCLSKDMPMMSGKVMGVLSLMLIVLLGVMFLLFGLEEVLGFETGGLYQSLMDNEGFMSNTFDLISSMVLGIALLCYLINRKNHQSYYMQSLMSKSNSSCVEVESFSSKDKESNGGDGYFNYFFKYNSYSGGSPNIQGDKSSFDKVSCVWFFSVLFILEFLIILYLLVCFSDLFMGMNMMFSFVVVLVYMFNNIF